MYERRTHPLLTRRQFAGRVARHLLFASILLALALGVGVLGYHFLGDLKWIDSLLNASMILGGMGPVDELKTTTAKLFASFYALFSGLVFLGVATMLVTPFAHRLLHHFHVPEK